MTLVEISVVLIGILIGYWLVSMLNASGKGQPEYEMPGPNARELPDPSSGQSEWHTVLGISPDATTGEVRDAYRLQISKYHPDKVALLGDEIRSVAERKSKEINAAYERALNAHGVVP